MKERLFASSGTGTNGRANDASFLASEADYRLKVLIVVSACALAVNTTAVL